jgi:hypothetical protein
MLATFFKSQGIIHKEFTPLGQTVNKEYYAEVLSRFIQRICRVRPQFQERGSGFLLLDNARPHTAVSIKQLLAKQVILELKTKDPSHILLIYPHQSISYSPKSNPC